MKTMNKMQDKAYHRNKAERNQSVKCNALYKNAGSFNCKLKPNEAIQLARALLMKAQLMLEAGRDEIAVHLWNKGSDNETLYCGIDDEQKGERKKKPPHL